MTGRARSGLNLERHRAPSVYRRSPGAARSRTADLQSPPELPTRCLALRVVMQVDADEDVVTLAKEVERLMSG